jgi:uncharacterized protein YjbI with pentapeptide repeats
MARARGPLPPRVSAPDLPSDLETVRGLSRHVDLLGARIEGLEGDVDAAHSIIAECTVAEASASRLDLTAATLTDVAISELRATEVVAREARWRNVLVAGGRLGTLDLSGAELDSVELRGVRVDYLSLRGASVRDVLVADCSITTLDLPMATLSRVRLEGSRADEVETEALRAEHVDFRGLEALALTRPESLRGVTLSPRQVELFAASFATALGIDVHD